MRVRHSRLFLCLIGGRCVCARASLVKIDSLGNGNSVSEVGEARHNLKGGLSPSSDWNDSKTFKFCSICWLRNAPCLAMRDAEGQTPSARISAITGHSDQTTWRQHAFCFSSSSCFLFELLKRNLFKIWANPGCLAFGKWKENIFSSLYFFLFLQIILVSPFSSFPLASFTHLWASEKDETFWLLSLTSLTTRHQFLNSLRKLCLLHILFSLAKTRKFDFFA